MVGVNGVNVKGKTKVEVAKMIQATKGEVSIKYNKLHADPKQGKTLDIVMKKVKHKMVENMTSSTADALGLSRAILCNDSLVKKLEVGKYSNIMVLLLSYLVITRNWRGLRKCTGGWLVTLGEFSWATSILSESVKVRLHNRSRISSLICN